LDLAAGVKGYTAEVKGSKLVLGLPWYGERYLANFNEGQVDYGDVLPILNDSSVVKKLEYNDKAQSWVLHCHGACLAKTKSDKKGDTIWFDDARSLKPKYKLAKDNGLLGVGIWKADSLSYDDKYAAERAAMWDAIANWNAPAALSINPSDLPVVPE
jgi:spore germination protein YaaH